MTEEDIYVALREIERLVDFTEISADELADKLVALGGRVRREGIDREQ